MRCVRCDGSGLYADEIGLPPTSEMRAMLGQHPCRICRGSGKSRRRSYEDVDTVTVDGARAYAQGMHRDVFGGYQ